MRTLRAIEMQPNIGQICDPARPRMLMPLGATHRRFEWMLLGHESIEQMERPETAWALLDEFGVTPDTHEIARQIVYTFQARIAERWREGNVLLSGDAAHTMPPFAGQGLLSSLRDSSNLAWKLDLVLRGRAADALLDTYESERRPDVLRVDGRSRWPKDGSRASSIRSARPSATGGCCRASIRFRPSCRGSGRACFGPTRTGSSAASGSRPAWRCRAPPADSTICSEPRRWAMLSRGGSAADHLGMVHRGTVVGVGRHRGRSPAAGQYSP